MISQQSTLFRANKMGKPYVQSTDPSIANKLVVNDMWLNPTAGTMKMWNGTEWLEMQFGASALMDDCIANRVLANDISASKITAGILRSQDGSVYVNLETGEAELLKLVMGGEIEGNIIATSSNGLTRVRLRGREGERNVTAGVIFEQREDPSDDDAWENAGQLYFAYSTRRLIVASPNYTIGAYNANRPIMAYNAGSADGLMWRMLSTDWLKAGYATYHGYRLMQRDTTNDSFEQVPAVCNAIGNCLDGTSVAGDGIVTVTYEMNDIVRLDFNLKITTAGTGTSAFGISPTLLRTLNADIPSITPVDGGTLQIHSSTGTLDTSLIGPTLKADNGLWTPASIASGQITALTEADMTAGMVITGTCYGTYSLEN